MADKTQQSFYSEEAPVFLLAALYAYILHNCSYFLPRQYLVWDTYVTNTVSHWEVKEMAVLSLSSVWLLQAG